MSLKFGILDQSVVHPNTTPAEAIQQTIKLAQLAERLGYERFWVSEHHDSPTIAGSSPEVLISHLLAHTSTIKIGSGGVMLQHYSPYKVAENFNLLATIAPSRVELGIGRAPGGLPKSTKALQKNIVNPDSLQEKLVELQQLLVGPLAEEHELAGLTANPKPQAAAPIFLLGTSQSSAELAAELGLPYAFALFINNDPEVAKQAFEHYRTNFNYEFGKQPIAILALSVIVADTEEEAQALAATQKNVRVTLASGKTVNVGTLEQAELFAKQAGEAYTAVEKEADITKGTKETVRKRILEFAEEYHVNDFIFTGNIADFDKRVKSFTLLKEVFEEELV